MSIACEISGRPNLDVEYTWLNAITRELSLMSFVRTLGVLALSLLLQAWPAAHAEPVTIKLGFAKCAHCLPMALTVAAQRKLTIKTR